MEDLWVTMGYKAFYGPQGGSSIEYMLVSDD